MLSDLLSLIPPFLAAFLASIFNDFIQHVNKEKKESFFVRSMKIFISAIVVVVIVSFGGSFIPIKIADWKMAFFICFVLGFAGYKIAELISNTTFGIKILGQGLIADAIDKKEKEEALKKKEQELEEKEKNLKKKE